MEKRFLGIDRLEVSAIGLGCIGFTHSYPPYPDKDTCIEVIRKAVDLGNLALYGSNRPTGLSIV